MKIAHQGHTAIIRAEKDNLEGFAAKLSSEFKTFESHHLIVDIRAYQNLSPADINVLMPFSKSHKKARKSFVIVADVDYNSASDQLVVVPSLTEAHDMIEMEEIERDLGF